MSVSSSTISTYVLSYTYFGYHLSPNEHVLSSLYPSPHSLFSIWKTPSHVSGFSSNKVFLPLERLLWLDQKQSIILYSVLLSALYMPTESRTCIVLVLTSPPSAFLPFGVLHDFYLTSVCPCTVHIVEGVRLRLKPIILITGCNEWFRYGRIPKSRQRCKRQAVLLDLKQVVPLLFLGKLEEKEKEEKNFLWTWVEDSFRMTLTLWKTSMRDWGRILNNILDPVNQTNREPNQARWTCYKEAKKKKNCP